MSFFHFPYYEAQLNQIRQANVGVSFKQIPSHNMYIIHTKTLRIITILKLYLFYFILFVLVFNSRYIFVVLFCLPVTKKADL